jgi:hypothetical protein
MPDLSGFGGDEGDMQQQLPALPSGLQRKKNSKNNKKKKKKRRR